MIKINFIGFGNMGKALAEGLALQENYFIHASAPSLPCITQNRNFKTHTSNTALIENAEIIMLAVKPTQLLSVLNEIHSFIPPQAILISVAAGVAINWLEKHTPLHQPIIRAMPNLAVKIQQGATALIANSRVTIDQKKIISAVFETLGIISWVENENTIDVLTALSGSGPAYLYSFVEAMIAAATNLGLEENLAKRFALQTARGAFACIEENTDVTLLKENVTSPRGTTAAALEIFQQYQLENIVSAAMKAAYERAITLAQPN